jgi:hypothetical protein
MHPFHVRELIKMSVNARKQKTSRYYWALRGFSRSATFSSAIFMKKLRLIWPVFTRVLICKFIPFRT